MLQQLNQPRVRYQYFDFHSECKHMRWDRISVLIEKMEEDLLKQGLVHFVHKVLPSTDERKQVLSPRLSQITASLAPAGYSEDKLHG